MSTTLYRGGVVHTPANPQATALLTNGTDVVWAGRDRDAPEADQVVELGGALVTPAFVDTHVHTTATGQALDGLDLTGCPSLGEALRRLERYAAARRTGIILGHGWDETHWPERRAPSMPELDAATGGRDVHLSRTDAHSCVVSTTLLAQLTSAQDLPGYQPDGLLRLEANREARSIAYQALEPDQRRHLQRVALKQAARVGLGCVHENATPGVGREDDLASLLDLAETEDLPEVIGYWGELGALEVARRHRLPGLAGDLFADGSLGSHTACLSEPYADARTSGNAAVTVEQVADHVITCTEHNLQAGFHAIGDKAIRTVLEGFSWAAVVLGADRIRAARHRLEHVELLDAEMIHTMARLGILASVQPIADTFWGGDGGMYARRLGPTRARAMNPFRALAEAGVPFALSSDAPIMPLGPWPAIRAAVGHHVPEHRIDVATAFHAHTVGGARAAGRDGGRLVPGADASLAVWDCVLDPSTRLPEMAAGSPDPVCRRTVVRGRIIHDLEE